MNCDSFEDRILELAGNEGLEESFRRDALAHAVSCSACATRLAEEKELNRLIRLSRNIPEEAPPRIESALIEKFRLRSGSSGGNSWSKLLQPVRAHRWGIAAAVVLVLLALPAYRRLQHIGDAHEQGDRRTAAGQPAGGPAENPEASAAESGSSDSRTEPAAVPDAPVADRVEAANARGETPVQETEIATDFISLTGSASLSTIESGQIVRVMLPRSALISYGLPVNQERWNDPIQAQVLLGQDGVAYAIRFMMETDSASYRRAVHAKQ